MFTKSCKHQIHSQIGLNFALFRTDCEDSQVIHAPHCAVRLKCTVKLGWYWSKRGFEFLNRWDSWTCTFFLLGSVKWIFLCSLLSYARVQYAIGTKEHDRVILYETDKTLISAGHTFSALHILLYIAPCSSVLDLNLECAILVLVFLLGQITRELDCTRFRCVHQWTCLSEGWLLTYQRLCNFIHCLIWNYTIVCFEWVKLAVDLR